jgi:hypothetical protein
MSEEHEQPRQKPDEHDEILTEGYAHVLRLSKASMWAILSAVKNIQEGDARNTATARTLLQLYEDLGGRVTGTTHIETMDCDGSKIRALIEHEGGEWRLRGAISKLISTREICCGTLNVHNRVSGFCLLRIHVPCVCLRSYSRPCPCGRARRRLCNSGARSCGS